MRRPNLIAPTSLARIRIALAVAWPAALAFGIYLFAGRIGFNPTDEGLIAAAADRLLDGQLPHRDFISPRPVGSALIHMVDFAVPMPLLPAGRLLSAGEVVLYSVLLAALIFDRPVWRFSPLQAIGAAASALVNLHTFPLMSWYTQDGILLVSLGAVLLRRGWPEPRARRVMGLLALGAAVLVKQSFIVAIPLGVAWLVWTAQPPQRMRAGLGALAVALAPPAAYAAVVAIGGGGAEMWTQVTSTVIPSGTQLLTQGVAWVGIAVVAALWGARALAGRARSGSAVHALPPVLALATVAWVAHQALDTSLAWQGVWGNGLFQGLLVSVVMRAAVEREVDAPAIGLLALAWMTALSFGSPVPDLVAGALGLAIVDRAVRGVEMPGRPRAWRALVAAAVVIVAVDSAAVFVHARQTNPYSDLAEANLTESLGRLAPDFGEIRTNVGTAGYLADVRACTRRYPAPATAVLPDNAALYPVLKLHNPFPIDWMWPGDYVHSRERILRAADAIGRRGGYLILFQTELGPDLPGTAPLISAKVIGHPSSYDHPLTDAIVARLHGRFLTCRSLLGIYEPKKLSGS